jgi:peptide/nickel transport system substrate-binding protein
MKKRKLILLLTFILVITNVLAGCGNGGDTPSEEPEGGEEAAVKDSLTVGVVAEPTTLDPSKGNDLLTFTLQYQPFDTLIKEDQDGNLVPQLAEDWEANEDGTEITFHLKEGVKFHNGETMTADDVVFSFNRAMESSYTSRITGSMESIEKIDDKTVKLTLKYPYGPIYGSIATANMGIVSQKAVEENEEEFGRNPVGTGPYKLVEWRSGDRIVFESFPEYFKGEAAIKDLTFKIIPDTSTALVALENGEVDMLLAPSAADRQNILNNENLQLYETEEASYLFVAFNTENGTFADKKLRQALSYAIDKEAVILGALEGNGTPLDAPMPPGVFGYPEDFKGNPYNPEKAKQLLAEAGYPDGLSVNLKAMESVTYSKPAEIIQENLRLVGIDANLELMERGAYLQDVYTDTNYEITVLVVSALVMDADLITYGRFHSSMVGGGNNFTRFQNEEMDAALELGRTSQDLAEREEAYLKVTEIVAEEAPLIPVMSGMRMIAAHKDLNGVTAHPVQTYYVYDYSWE